MNFINSYFLTVDFNKINVICLKRKPQTPADSVKLESSIKTKGKAGAKATSKAAVEKESKDSKRQVFYKK